MVGNRLNLWQDFAEREWKGSWRLLHRHIYRVLAKRNRERHRYIIRWIAWCLQNPNQPCEAVLVLTGEEGTGKGTLAYAIRKLFGVYALRIAKPEELVGSFSGHLQHCVFLFLDEALWHGGMEKFEGRLKELVTEDMITIRPLYVGTFQVRNLLHIMIASNNDKVVPAGPRARRYAVFEASEERINDFPYFEALREEIDGGGAAAMLYDLLRMDLKGWAPRQIPITDELIEQKQHSLTPLWAWVEAILQAGALPKPQSDKYPNRCSSAALLESARQFKQYTNERQVTDTIKKALDCKSPGHGSGRVWEFPPLVDCRKRWERHYGGKWNWDNTHDEWTKPKPLMERAANDF